MSISSKKSTTFVESTTKCRVQSVIFCSLQPPIGSSITNHSVSKQSYFLKTK